MTTDRIITAKDYGGSAREYIKKQQRTLLLRKGVSVTIKDMDKQPVGKPVYARIWKSQWIADCECKGASFVDPDEPVFFCFSCGNFAHGSKLRPVVFPPEAERKEIERLLLERPQEIRAGLTDLERVAMAVPLLYVETEEYILETASMDKVISAMQKGELPPPGKMVKRKPLTRSWRPGESVNDLIQQQDKAIKEYKAKKGRT